MAANFLKLWVQGNLSKLAVNRARNEIQSTGQALPCSVVAVNGSIVTVKFEVNAKPWTLPQITIPKAESPWVRSPTQVGDKGLTMPADAYLGGMSGLGGGVATMAKPGNLSALVFVPISNKNSPPIDPTAAQIEGPNGVISRTTTGTTSEVVTSATGTTITFGSNSFAVTESAITMTLGGKVVQLTSAGLTIDGILFDTHVHGGVTTGSDPTTGPLP